MKLFVDTGNLKEVEALAQLGILDGVTTNPSLLAKEAGDYRQILKQICQTVKGPVSAEVVATDTAGMLREGRDLALIDEHIVIKVPFTKDGVRACKTLASEGHRVNVTLIFSAAQAWLAAKVGAAYVSPFVGRLDDIGATGMSLVREIVDIFDNSELTTEVLVASVRNPDSHHRGGADGRRRCDGTGRGHRAVLQAPAHRHRPRAVPQRLGEGAGGEGINIYGFTNLRIYEL